MLRAAKTMLRPGVDAAVVALHPVAVLLARISIIRQPRVRRTASPFWIRQLAEILDAYRDSINALHRIDIVAKVTEPIQSLFANIASGINPK